MQLDILRVVDSSVRVEGLLGFDYSLSRGAGRQEARNVVGIGIEILGCRWMLSMGLCCQEEVEVRC